MSTTSRTSCGPGRIMSRATSIRCASAWSRRARQPRRQYNSAATRRAARGAEPEPRRIPHMRGVVVCPQPLAAEIGAAVLDAGGNAFDAAIATAFAQTVTDPHMCGLGGFGAATCAAGGRAWHVAFHARIGAAPPRTCGRRTAAAARARRLPALRRPPRQPRPPLGGHAGHGGGARRAPPPRAAAVADLLQPAADLARGASPRRPTCSTCWPGCPRPGCPARSSAWLHEGLRRALVPARRLASSSPPISGERGHGGHARAAGPRRAARLLRGRARRRRRRASSRAAAAT